MADNTETFVIKLKDQGVETGLRDVGDETDKAHGKVNALNGAFRVFGGILAGISIAHIGGEVIDTLAKFERFEAVLTNTLGSNSAAKKALSEITDFAARTPFEVDTLTDSFVKLANQGFTPTMREMTKMGDLAASKGKDMGMLAEAIIDAEVGEMERLKEFGVRASKSGDQVKFTFKGVETQVKNTDTEIRNYLLSLGDLQGVSGSMAAISETTGGKISNMKDSVTQLYLVIGKSLKPEIDALIAGLSGTIEWLGKAVTWLGSGSTGAEVFKGAVVALTVGLVAYNAVVKASSTWIGIVTAAQWLWNAAMTANPIGLIVAGVAALIAVIAYAANQFTGWGEAWKHTVSGAKLLFAAFVSNTKAIWNGLIDGFMIGINTIKKGWYEFKNAVGLGDKSENLSIIQRIDADTERRKKEIVDSAVETARLGMEALNEFKLAAGSIKKKTKEEIAAEEKEDAVNGKKFGAGSITGTTGGAKGKKVSAGISEIKASAPKVFNINIESLIKENNINTNNLTEGTVKIKEMLTRALLTAVNDSQIIAE